jgi:hypothetical protein
MRKAILGFLAGIALTSLAFVLLTGEPAAPVAEGTLSVSPPSRSATDPGGEDIPGIDPPTIAETASTDPSSAAISDAEGIPADVMRVALRDWTWEDARDSLRAWTDVELENLQDRAVEMTQPSKEMQDAERVMNLARQELARRNLVAHWANEPPPELPIELPPQFSWMAENPNTLHEQLQREPVDSTWSLQTEDSLRRFLTSRPEITNLYGLPTVNCRTSTCQIAFVAHGMEDPGPSRAGEGVNGGRPKLSADLSEAIRPIYDQSWANQLNRGQEYRNFGFQPGATTILVHIRRTGER